MKAVSAPSRAAQKRVGSNITLVKASSRGQLKERGRDSWFKDFVSSVLIALPRAPPVKDMTSSWSSADRLKFTRSLCSETECGVVASSAPNDADGKEGKEMLMMS